MQLKRKVCTPSYSRYNPVQWHWSALATTAVGATLGADSGIIARANKSQCHSCRLCCHDCISLEQVIILRSFCASLNSDSPTPRGKTGYNHTI
jgi:hypothetical protein